MKVALAASLLGVLSASNNNNKKLLKPPIDKSVVLGEHFDTCDIQENMFSFFGVYNLLTSKNLFPPSHNLLPVDVGNRVFEMHEEMDSLTDKYLVELNAFLENVKPVVAALYVEDILMNVRRGVESATKFLVVENTRKTKKNTQKKLDKTTVHPIVKELLKFYFGKGEGLKNKIHDLTLKHESMFTQRNAEIGNWLKEVAKVFDKASQDIGGSIKFDGGNFNVRGATLKGKGFEKALENSSKYLASWLGHLTSEKVKIELQDLLFDDKNYGFGMLRGFVSVINNMLGIDIAAKYSDLDDDFFKQLPHSIAVNVTEIGLQLIALYESDEVSSFALAANKFSNSKKKLNMFMYRQFTWKTVLEYGIEVRKEIISILEKEVTIINSQLNFIMQTELNKVTDKECVANNSQSNITVQSEGINKNVAAIRNAIKLANTTLIVSKHKIQQVIGELEDKKNEVMGATYDENDKMLLVNQQFDLASSIFMNYIEDVKVNFVNCFDAVAEGLLSILAKGGVDITKYNYEKCENTESFSQYSNHVVELVRTLVAEVKKLNKKPEDLINLASQDSVNESEENIIQLTQPSNPSLKKPERIRLGNYQNESRLCPFVPDIIADLRPVERRDFVRVSTFNAQWLFPFPLKDGSFMRGSMEAARDHLRDIASVLSQLDSDIIFLQEVQDCRALKAVAALMESKYDLSGYKAYLLESRDETLGQHVGILTRIDPTELKVIPGYGDYSVAKSIFARFGVLNQEGVEFNFALVGVHLISGEDRSKRDSQADAVVHFINKEIDDTENVIILGDMNDYDETVAGHSPYSAALNKLTSSKHITRNIFKNRHMESTPQTQRSRGIIDHILVDEKLVTRNPKIDPKLVWKSNTISISDHAPVSVDIKLISKKISNQIELGDDIDSNQN